MKTPTNLRMITEDEFHKLKSGDVVYIKASGHIFQGTVLNKPIWNSDADEPDWEVETTNGWSDMYSLYVRYNHNLMERKNMKDISIEIKQDDGNVLSVNTDMIEEDVIRTMCGLKQKEQK